MLDANDFIDAGALIGFAIQPTKRLSDLEYRRTLGRYRAEPDFRDAVDGILEGLSMQVTFESDYGLFLGVRAESPFAFRPGDMPRSQEPRHRLLGALVLAGIAAYTFPSAEELEEDRVRQINEGEVESWLRAACRNLQGKDAAGEPIPDEGLDQAWRHFDNLQIESRQARGPTGRLSPTCSLYWVHNLLGFLAEQGMARPDTLAGEGNWQLTERFRIQVRNMGAGSAYEYLRGIHSAPDATDLEGTP